VAFPEGVARSLDEVAAGDCSPWLVPGQTQWFDNFGLDSLYDYDPVWEACRQLGFAATFHGGLTVRPGLHWSISNYVVNHLGQFAAEMFPLCKSLLFGGVTKRFPDVSFVFLECGVSWGMQLLGDTIEHWEKRNSGAMQKFDPARLDREQLGRYFEQYGGRLAELLGGDAYDYVQGLPIHGAVPEQPDEFVHMDIKDPAGIVELFADSFFFGCEAGRPRHHHRLSPVEPGGSRAAARVLVRHRALGCHRHRRRGGRVVRVARRRPSHRGPVAQAGLREPGRDVPPGQPGFFDGTPVAAYLAGAKDGRDPQ